MRVSYTQEDFRFLVENVVLLFERLECRYKDTYLRIIKEKIETLSYDVSFLKAIEFEALLKSMLNRYFGTLFDEQKSQNLQKTRELFEKSLEDGAYFVAFVIYLCGEFFVMEYYDEPEKSLFSFQNIQIYQMH